MMRRGLWMLASACILVMLIFVWQAVADARIVSPVFFPGPDKIWMAIRRSFAAGDLVPRVLATIWRMLLGWALASIFGVALGAMIGTSAMLRRLLGPILEFLRPLPASATIPIFIACFGLTDSMVLAVIAFGALWPMLLGTMHGFQAVEPRLYEVARVLKLSRTATIWKIALPSALPDILSGLRLSLTVALILTVVCEMLVGVDGVGSWTLISARSFRSADLYAGVVLLGLIGCAGAMVISAASARLLSWKVVSKR
jgi:sulfonate transport system permease protein